MISEKLTPLKGLPLNNDELVQELDEFGRKKHDDIIIYLKGIIISIVNECLFGLLLLASLFDPHNYWKGP